MLRYVMILLVAAMAFGSGAQAKPGFLVDADWLDEHGSDASLVILDAHYYPHRYHTSGHVPGARQVQRFRDLGDNFGNPNMRFPSKQQFQATLRRWGVNDGSTVVIYDDSRMPLAARIYWLMKLYGFDMSKVKILDGGAIGWSGFNDMVKDKPKVAAGNVTLKPANKDLFVEWTVVYDKVISQLDPAVVLIDARPGKHYTGEVAVHATRGGHIPGAINIVSLDGLSRETHEWSSGKELAELYKGIGKDKQIIVYSHDGFRMSLTYLQLTYLGYKNVKLYNGGWMHWGNALALPVVKGKKPFDKSFDF